MPKVKQSGYHWLWLSLLIVVSDQWVKAWVLQHLIYEQPAIVFDTWLNLTLAFNRGAAFSFLGAAGGWQVYFFAVVSLLIVLLFTVWLVRTPPGHAWRRLGLALVIGGAVGNLIDRLRLSYVIDYVDFHLGSWHFATFNLADAAISVGACCLIFSLLQHENKKRNT